MELKDILKKLESSDEFASWKTHHKNAFLAHAFVMLDDANKNTWQIGYFDEEQSLMSTFVVSAQKIDLIPDQEVLKADQRILPLNPDDVKIPLGDALAAAQKAKLEHYPREHIAKSFFIIQNIEAHGPVFNITYFTAAFKTINVKILSKNGAVAHHSLQALAAFG
jgi:hypothetical protein